MHTHRFIVTEEDELGRQFGYCGDCLRDMQDLGRGLLVYQSHKRARQDLCERTDNAPPTDFEKALARIDRA